ESKPDNNDAGNIKDFQNAIFAEAKSLIADRRKVFPLHSITEHGVCSCGNPHTDDKDAGKHPRTTNGVQDASNDPEQIRKWFDPELGAPLSNLAIATGEGSDLTVLDIDIGPDKCGADTWRELIEEHGEPNTRMVETGSGGIHVFFKYN